MWEGQSTANAGVLEFPHGADWNGYHMALVVTQHGNRYILIIQDYYSKLFELIQLAHHTAKYVEDMLINEFFTRYGVCEWIHSDQGSKFDSHIMKEGYQLWGVTNDKDLTI